MGFYNLPFLSYYYLLFRSFQKYSFCICINLNSSEVIVLVTYIGDPKSVHIKAIHNHFILISALDCYKLVPITRRMSLLCHFGDHTHEKFFLKTRKIHHVSRKYAINASLGISGDPILDLFCLWSIRSLCGARLPFLIIWPLSKRIARLDLQRPFCHLQFAQSHWAEFFMHQKDCQMLDRKESDFIPKI